MGRLTAIGRASASVAYAYDRFGRALQDGDLTYSYDLNGNRTTIGYPGGVTATYGYDFADRQETLVVDDGANPTQSVVSSATYKPSGPLATMGLGNGLTEIRGFDQRYFPASIELSGVRTWSYTVDDVGNLTRIDETAGCTPTVAVDNQTLTSGVFEACMEVTSANTTIDPPGPVTFRAGESVRLDELFTVSDGAEFIAENDIRLAPFSFTYAYQDHQYFLTQGVGHWGTLDYTYDRIGNRLSEARTVEGESGPVTTTDAYAYLQNATPANTPTLDTISLGLGGTRSYTYGPAGHLANVTAGANTIDFTTGDDGRLVGLDRLSGTNTSAFTYDGRSFLSEVDTPVGVETATTEPTYSSEGLLHGLLRQESSTVPQERLSYFYFAGRPVAQLRQEGGGTEWTFLTADHLGTPFIATDLAGDETWLGPFEPFGRDPLQGTAAGARDSGIFLRFPGQWDDGRWQDASSGADLYYNVHRWYEHGTGRFARVDPLGHLGDAHQYVYGLSDPTRFVDPNGLKVTYIDPTLADFVRCALAAAPSMSLTYWPFFDSETGDDWEIRQHPSPTGRDRRLPIWCIRSSCWTPLSREVPPSSPPSGDSPLGRFSVREVLGRFHPLRLRSSALAPSPFANSQPGNWPSGLG